jgi:hypothetical protein
MARRLLTIASALLLLLCIGAVAFWAHSYERRGEIQFRWHGKAYALASERGRVGIDNQLQLQEFAGAVERAQQDVRNSTAAYLGRSDGHDPYLAEMVRTSNRLYTLTGRGPPAPVRFAIPYWAIVGGALVLPAMAVWKWQRRQLRIAANRCAECGYDLRAAKDQCPECGTTIHRITETEKRDNATVLISEPGRR